MLFPTPDMIIPPGPPPQAILNQRWLWHILLMLLGMCFIVRFIGLDIPGALLSGLMFCFAVIMTRDGMVEISRYALVFAVLCGLNFFFDVLPLLTELAGRVQSRTVPVSTQSSTGILRTVYTVTVKTTPFFDLQEGLIYNMQSFGMLLSPLCMALGVYLSISAHNEFQRSMPTLFDDGFMEAGGVQARQPIQDREPSRAIGQERDHAPLGGQNSFNHFQGRGHKLAE